MLKYYRTLIVDVKASRNEVWYFIQKTRQDAQKITFITLGSSKNEKLFKMESRKLAKIKSDSKKDAH